MNYPGNPSGNWTWRMPAEALNEELQERIKEINNLYGRSNTCNSQDQK
jgi:4-alpha-glucanotransferase